jgi:hypothetical protein
MNNPNIDQAADRAREAQAAREALMRQAEEEGIQPFDYDNWEGNPEFEVDDFIKALREWRSIPSTRSLD